MNPQFLLIPLIGVGSLLFARQAFAEQSGPFTYTVADGEVTITDYADPGTAHHLDIPAVIEGDPVTTIGDGAFDLSSFTSITIPASVAHLGQLSFQGCVDLLSLTIPSTLESIGEAAFFENYGLRSLVFEDDDISLENAIFVRCRELRSVRLGEGMTQLGTAMFANCIELASIDIPDSVTSVGNQAFSGCARLTSARLGVGAAEIADRQFSGCSSLESVLIPTTITTIGEEAFAGCRSLRSVLIPASVTTIREGAFQSCRDMHCAIFLGDAPGVFMNGDPGALVPNGVFAFHSDGFKVFFVSGNAGFAEPEWMNEPSESLDAATLPPAPWLVSHALPLDSDFSQPLNPQGVDLLTCYAFNLDPRNPNVPDTLRFRNTPTGGRVDYYGASPGVIYRAQISADLTNWTESGVTTLPPAPDGRSSSSFSTAAPRSFLRVNISQGW